MDIQRVQTSKVGVQISEGLLYREVLLYKAYPFLRYGLTFDLTTIYSGTSEMYGARLVSKL